MKNFFTITFAFFAILSIGNAEVLTPEAFESDIQAMLEDDSVVGVDRMNADCVFLYMETEDCGHCMNRYCKFEDGGWVRRLRCDNASCNWDQERYRSSLQ